MIARTLGRGPKHDVWSHPNGDETPLTINRSSAGASLFGTNGQGLAARSPSGVARKALDDAIHFTVDDRQLIHPVGFAIGQGRDGEAPAQ